MNIFEQAYYPQSTAGLIAVGIMLLILVLLNGAVLAVFALSATETAAHQVEKAIKSVMYH